MACAQTRTFTTGPPVEDSVTGSWVLSPHYSGQIDARSGPEGQHPQGSVQSIYAPISLQLVHGLRHLPARRW